MTISHTLVEGEKDSSKCAPSIAVTAGLPPHSRSHRLENVNTTLPPPLLFPLSIPSRKSVRIIFNLVDNRS